MNNSISAPQAIDLEDAVLGAMLLDKYAIERVVDILSIGCFYKDENKYIFGAIIELYRRNKPIDLLTLSHILKEKGELERAGGIVYVTSLTNRVASSANIDFHARVIIQEYLKRELLRLSHLCISDVHANEKEVFDLYSTAISRLEGAVAGVVKYDVSPISKIHEQVIKDSRKIAQSGHRSGITTGYRNLDTFLNGWQRTDLIILAGRPAMGKSVCALAFALNPALYEHIPTAIFSLEMSSEQLVGRSQSVLSEIDSSRIIKKQLELHEIDLIERRCADLKTAPIYIDDTPSLSLIELKSKTRKLVRDKGVKLIIIDYLQLMTVEINKNYNRELEVSTISKGLKALAKELDIPIIALSQLNRAVEGRSEKKPQLSDLRESGSIEQDADMVIFCYRPEYYGIQNYEMGLEQMSSEGLMVLIVAKHRAGQLGELRLGFQGKYTKLLNYDTYLDRTKPQAMPQFTIPNKITPAKEEPNNEIEIPF